jgi:hypothetical protein
MRVGRNLARQFGPHLGDFRPRFFACNLPFHCLHSASLLQTQPTAQPASFAQKNHHSTEIGNQWEGSGYRPDGFVL